MSEGKMETAIGMCVVTLTKYIMKKQDISHEAAYRKLLTMELYGLLRDSETRLFLETNEYLCNACEKEMVEGKDALYEYINT